MYNKKQKFIKKHLVIVLKFHILILLISVLILKNANANANERNHFDKYYKASISQSNWNLIFQNASLLIIDSLLKKNYHNLGDLNLNNLKKEISNLKWRFIQGIYIEVGTNGSRSTAVYSIIDKLIIVSLEEWVNAEPSLQNIIALHEALGALGYRDENYQISLTLAQLNALSSEVIAEIQGIYDIDMVISYLISAPVLKNPIKKIQPTILADGGSSGTMGGGDIRSLSTKFFLLTAYPTLMKIQNITDPSLLKELFYLIIDCEIESTIENINTTDHKINIDKTIVSLNQGHLKITIPKNIQFFYKREQSQINWTAQYSVNLVNKIINIVEGSR